LSIHITNTGVILPETIYGQCYTDPRLNDKRLTYPFKRRDRFYRLSMQGIFQAISAHHGIEQGIYKRQRQGIAQTLSSLGLPMPHKDIIHRGREHDLLFMYEYGLVIRVGDIDIPSLIHPRNLQPLICVRGEGRSSDVSIYPGIRLFRSALHGGQKKIDELDKYFIGTEQGNFDITDYNSGFIDLSDEESLLVNLDIDNDRCGTLDRKLKAQKSEQYARLRGENAPQAIAIREVLSTTYDHLDDDGFIEAYDRHQDLRLQLQDAVSITNPQAKAKALGAFYQSCRDAVNGVHADVALYAPWSGRDEDNQQKPTGRLIRPNGPA
jgi:hypothetical protein